MGAGLSMQQTFERPDNIPLEPAQGLAVVTAYGLVTLLVALGRRASRHLSRQRPHPA